uniref:Uncharacterized protein n=1 Tax=Aegilops tauschii subsp. strangulata TaxID=200361 RepID=A0A453B1A4_AEGTS
PRRRLFLCTPTQVSSLSLLHPASPSPRTQTAYPRHDLA